MRIAFITFEYPPHINGGAGVYAENITQELAKLGHQIVVFSPDIKDSEEKCSINNLDIRKIKINNKIPFKALQFWIRLPKLVEKEGYKNKFDIIHFNGISYWFLKRNIYKAPHIITIHHSVKNSIKNNNPNLISKILDISGENSLFMPFIEKRCIKSADKIIAVSNFTKDQIIKNYKIPSNKIHVIYNGINLNDYILNKEEVEETRNQLGLDKKPIILFVGRVDDPRKGLDLLLDAFKNVLEKVDATVLVVGSGDQTKAVNLSKLLKIQKNIIFTGYVNDETLKKYYALCDLYVCPSRLEGFGLTIIEAMAAGKPIVATNVGAIPEIVQSGERWLLVEPGDKIALSNAILKYITNSDIMCQICLKNIESIKTKFNWQFASKQITDIYEYLICNDNNTQSNLDGKRHE